MLLLDEHSPRIPAAKRRLMVWPLQPRSSTEAFCLKSSHVHICSTPVFKRALLSSEHVRWTLTPLRACPALPYPTLAARGQDKRTPTYPTHKPDPLTTYPLPGKEPEPSTGLARGGSGWGEGPYSSTAYQATQPSEMAASKTEDLQNVTLARQVTSR